MSAELLASDGYAKELAKWRARLAAWEQSFESWDLKETHVHPPAPPKTTKWFSKTKPELNAQREAAYEAANAATKALGARWEERNAQRTKERGQAKEALRGQRERDWAAEREAREDDALPPPGSREWRRIEEEECLLLEDGPLGGSSCSCRICAQRVELAAEEQARLTRKREQRDAEIYACGREQRELEAKADAVTEAQLEAQPPAPEEVERAQMLLFHGNIRRGFASSISPLALAAARANLAKARLVGQVEAVVEAMIGELEEEEEERAIQADPARRRAREREELYEQAQRLLQPRCSCRSFVVNARDMRDEIVAMRFEAMRSKLQAESQSCARCLPAGSPCMVCIRRASLDGLEFPFLRATEREMLLYLKWCVPMHVTDESQPWPKLRSSMVISWSAWPEEWPRARCLRDELNKQALLARDLRVHGKLPPALSDERAAVREAARAFACPHRKGEADGADERDGYGRSREETGTCEECWLALLAAAVQLRFEGDTERRRAWLRQREQARTVLAEWQERKESLMKRLKAWEREQEAAKRRAEEEEEEERRRVELARVGAAAAAAGRPPISAENAAEWPPPDFDARGDDGEVLHVVERRLYRPTMTFGPPLTREEFDALPAEKRVLCQQHLCAHKAQKHERWPRCQRHCRCEGYELVATPRSTGPQFDYMVRSSCRYYESRTILSVIDLSEPILWYWQMTGEVWYDLGMYPWGWSRYDVWPLPNDPDVSRRRGEKALQFGERVERAYATQVAAWHALQGSERAAGKQPMKRKRHDKPGPSS